ncbi:sugar ABC transporter permease [Paenibacillus thalictri]|uniref:Sugar ABC transporter permease n=2 Tax=Paenibacillus thalictri TaxID=2527873 RepID=A0A4V2J3Q4_9BACL|nr:sugar ABC transporter permease [Paenibacillus thalictri]
MPSSLPGANQWKRQSTWKRGIPMYLMILPGLLFFIIFKYIPMGGLIIAFQEYDPFEGFMGSAWVGTEHFQRLFTDPDFWMLLQNTLILSALNLFLFFPAPIVFAVLLNEVHKAWFRKTVQTIIYMPHFLSWVIVVSITVVLFATQDGGINNLLDSMGYERIELMTSPDYFRFLYVGQNIWKETGWNAIIFLAALAAVDPTLYEAAVVDGANRWSQVWHITLPALKSTIIILFILRLGQVMELGFEHILLLQNPVNMNVADVFDTYVYRNGVLQGNFSYATTVGIFKSVIGLILIVAANRLAKAFGQEGVY